MTRYAFLLILFFTAKAAFGQDKNYSVGAIPEALKKNAHSVIRSEHYVFEVRSTSKAVLNTDRVITLLDESEKDELLINFGTDKFHSLGDVSIKLIDASGTVLSKYNKKDFNTVMSSEGLVPDGKVYYLRLIAPEFPITIESHVSIVYYGIFTYPAFRIQEPSQSVENTEYVFKLPYDMDFRYTPKNTDIKPVTGDEGNKYHTYTWTTSSLPAKAYDEESGPIENSFPMIVMAPTKFELDGYEGDMTSWKNLGLWYNNLVKNDNKLSEENRKAIVALVKDAKDDLAKIKILYNYLQMNFRYVSIQLGIGGLKPFSADFVHKNRYGDCKALSNYMEACLDAVNIKGYSAWIRAGSGSHLNSDPAFPYDHFNHQILCVPMRPDTVWLECTSPVNETGFLGSFTDDRDALLLTENGGVLVQTPKNPASANTINSNTLINLYEDGSGTVHVTLLSTGNYRNGFLGDFIDAVKDEQKKYLVNGFGFMQPDKFDVKHESNERQAAISINMEIERIPDFSAGNKLFLNPRIYKLWKYALPKAENRTQDYYFDYPLVKTDTTTYKLPDGFGLETLPKPKELKFEYGTFTSAYRYDEQQKTIVSTARLVLTEYRIPVAMFAAAKKFFNDVLAEYTEKIVIKRL